MSSVVNDWGRDTGSSNLPGGLGWAFVERFIIKCLCILSSLNLLIAPFISLNSSVTPVLLFGSSGIIVVSFGEHESLLSLGSLVQVSGLLSSAPVSSLNARVAPVSSVSKRLWGMLR
jgi:hypothetical protein